MVIIDTSVWVPALRRRSQPSAEDLFHKAEVDRLLALRRAAMVGPVLTELLRGARSDEDFAWLHAHLTALPFIPTTEETWVRAGLRLYQLRRQGITVGFVDAVIATLAMEGDHEVYAIDTDFQHIPGLKLYQPSPRP